jgi:hypothetical protein
VTGAFGTLAYVSGAGPSEHEAPDDRIDEQSTPTVMPTESEWSVNWAGAGVLFVLVVVGLVAWRSFGGDGGDAVSSSGDAVAETVAATQPPVPSTTSTVSPTTVAPTTVAATTTTTPEPRVLISGVMKPCRFGDRCLVASFTIEGFEQTSGEFVCIYPNSLSQFSFRDGGREDACTTADAGDTIAIEVDGVRSAVVSEENLTGAP